MIKVEATETSPNKFDVTFDIQPLADKLGVSKQKAAELLADELMKILGI